MKTHLFFTSLMLTILIFSTAMVVNYGLDFLRLGSILNVIQEHEISSEAYLVEGEFIETFGGDKCSALNNEIERLKKEIEGVGTELSDYGEISFFKKQDYDYLERKYFLLELKFLASIENLNQECNRQYIPIIFFYEVDNDISKRQGYILSEISKEYKNRVVVLSIDKNYKKEPLIKLLVKKYNITKAPTIIIADEERYVGLKYMKEIAAVINNLIRDADFHGLEHDFGFVLKRTKTNKDALIKSLRPLLDEDISFFAKGDISLIIGRLTKNNTLICQAVDFYEAVETSNPEEKALIYETIASIGCGRNKRNLFLNASKLWTEIGNEFRAKIDLWLADNYRPRLEFSISPLKVLAKHKDENISLITIGKSSITLTNKDVVVSQADRVSRDWLSYQINSSPFSENLLTVFSERLTYTKDELLPSIGWHEGGRIKELKRIGVKHKIASGTIVARLNGKWYAPDEKGIFRFDVPIDKVLYPTTRFLKKDIAIVIDTHGINMIVEQAVRNNATVAIGCCDNIGKIKAAKYLAEKGIDVICFTDKYLPLLLGQNYTILGSPPIKIQGSVAIVGNQPISFNADSKIIAEDVGNYTNVQSYYDTPARYFRQLEKMADLNVIYVQLDKMKQTEKIIEAANLVNANVIGVRIFNSDDYKKVKEWLEENPNNKAILFHSASYPYGYKLMHEFPTQTTFDDINPILA